MLDEADFFETAHKSAAQSGQSAVPIDLENVEEHFITFIEAENSKGYVPLPSLGRQLMRVERNEWSRWTADEEGHLIEDPVPLSLRYVILYHDT